MSRAKTVLAVGASLLLAASACGTDAGTDHRIVAYSIGDLSSSAVATDMEADYKFVEFAGQTDGAVLVAAAAIESLTSEQLGQLTAAFDNGQVVGAFDVTEAQLDALAKGIGAPTDYTLPRKSDGSPGDLAEVYAFDKLENGYAHFVYTASSEPITAEEAMETARDFGVWLETDRMRPLPALGGTEDSPIDVVSTAAAYTGTYTGTVEGVKVQAVPLIYSAYSVDQQAHFIMVRNDVAMNQSSTAQLKSLLLVLDLVYDNNGATETFDKTLEQVPCPQGSPVSAETVMTGVNYTISGSVSVGTTGPSVSSSVGATFVDTDSFTRQNLEIVNNSDITMGFGDWTFNWASPPIGTAVGNNEFVLFIVPQSVVDAHAGEQLKLSGVISIETCESNGAGDFNYNIPLSLVVPQ